GFDRDHDPLADPNYTSRFNGTSAAAPLVTGVIALMLEANPNLTYRDVQEILVRSSRTTAWYESPSAYGNDQIDQIVSGASATGASTGTTTLSSPAAGLGSPGTGLAAATDYGDAPGYVVASHDFDTLDNTIPNPNDPLLGTQRDDGPTV